MTNWDKLLHLVREANKIVPFAEINRLKAENTPVAHGWPKFCDAPLEENLLALLMPLGLDPESAFCETTLVTACYMWKKNKVIYSFDDDLSLMLAAQTDNLKYTDILPSDILTHPPYPCTFIRTNVFDLYCGFWYWVWFDTSKNVAQLHVQLVKKDMKAITPRALNLLPGKTIQECFDDTVGDNKKNVLQSSGKGPVNHNNQPLHTLLVALQFIIYIMAENADIQDIPSKKVAKRRKKARGISNTANKVNEKLVGVRIGSAIRKARASSHSSPQGSTGFTKRPHSRRGHWHHYWVGPRDGERSLILKWVAPTIIHENAFRNDTVVVFPVKQ